MITKGYIVWKRLLVVILILVFLVPEARAFWVWTPETKKWVNPKYVTKETAQEQFEWALEFYEAGDYTRAIDEWRKLIKQFPLSEFAPESQFHIGLAHQAQGDHYRAYLAYQKVLDDYPQTKRVKEIIEKEYQIANLLYTTPKAKLIGMGIPSGRGRAVEIFRKIVENAPYGEYADLTQYKIGSHLKDSRRYQEARDAFDKIIDEYPNSELLDDARFERASCLAKISLEAEYDQEVTDEAIKGFEDFIVDYPQSNVVDEARKILAQLNERKAECAFKIAQFYERQGSIDSAVMYYKEVRDKYGTTSWAARAMERIVAIEKGSGS